MRSLLLTPYSLFLLGAGVAFLYFFPAPLLFLAYNGALLALLAVELRFIPPRRSFTVEREVQEIISLGEGARVGVVVRIRGKDSARLQLKGRDEIPANTGAEPRELLLERERGAVFTGEYRLFPRRRGDHRFGRFNLRCRGPLRLMARQYSFAPEKSLLKVYPRMNLPAGPGMFVPPSLLRREGLRASRMVSLGTEFESLREYVPDDDHRQINWKASARSGTLISNRYQVEKSQSLVLVFEAGRMMLSAAAGSYTKLDHALNAGLMLGHAALCYGDRVGAMTYADRVKAYLPPGSRSGQIRRIAAAVYRLQPERVEPDYGSVFAHLGHRQKKRSLVCVFTDLVDSRASSELIENALALSQKHLLLFVVVGDGYLQKAAAGEMQDIKDMYRKAVVEQYLLEREQGMAYLRNRGVEVVELLPGADPVKLVGRYLELKSRYRL